MLNNNFWARYFKVYDILNLTIPYRELLENLVKEVNIKKGELILDAGGGSGNLSLLLEAKGATVINFDFSKEAIDICKRKNINIKTIQGDLTQRLPFDDNYFDKIVSNNVLYNIQKNKRLKTMQEFKRILKPNGRIVISNIHKEFRPIKIYVMAIKENIKRKGFFSTVKLVIKMAIPTVKMFYYNFFIKKEYKFSKNNLFDLDEQRKILEEAGLQEITETKIVYAGQGILNSATKPRHLNIDKLS